MAEDSLLWDGTTTGHAASTDLWSAPYSSAEMSDLLSTLFGSDAARAYVIPGYGNDLKVQANSPVALNVIGRSGRVMVRGRLYGNTADNTLSLSTADATNPRLDRIVARISFAAQTITLAVLTGTPAATPSLPSLTQNATTYELPLAYVWVAATATTIANTEIHDERQFAANFESLLSTLMQPNLITNSEFMAFSRLNTVSGTNNGRPDNWTLVGTATFASATKPSQMSRGRATQITAGAGSSGMSQTFRAKGSTVYSFKILINVTAGDMGVLTITDNGGSPNTVTRNIRRTGSYIEEIIYYTTPSDATTITVSLLANSNTDIIAIGQTLASEGYLTGNFRQIHETIIFDHQVNDSAWDGDTKSTSTVTIDLDTDFQALILPGTKAVYLHTTVVDSGASGNLAFRAPSGTTSLYVVLSHGGALHTGVGIIPVDVNNQFEIRVTASGAGTLIPNVSIVGILV